MEHLQQLVLGLIDHYGLPGLFVGMTLGNIGAPVGAEIVMPAAGGEAGREGTANPALAAGRCAR